ncbi:MAG: glycosyltransferase family 39 protein, partial [Pseudomonadota bacterium]
MTRDLRPLWRIVALVGVAWWLADRWLFVPAPPLPWSLARGDLWGLPVQGLLLAAAALLLRRDRLALIPLILLLVSALAPVPGVDRAPLAILHYGALLGIGTPMGILAGVAGFTLVAATLAGLAAVLSGRLEQVAGALLLVIAVAPPLVQLLLDALGASPVASGRLGWSLVASGVGFGLVWLALPRLVADGAVARPGRWERRVLTALLPVGVLVAYVAVKLEAAGLSAGDENIYFYDVLLFTRGLLPYRDFFFAHPPLHVVLPGLLCMVTGFSLPLLKLLPLVASCVTGLAAWDTVRRSFGAVGAAAALVGWLFALEQLQASSNLTGVNLTVLFMALSLWCVVRHRPLAGGLLAGAAVSTGIYAAPLLAAVPLVLAYRDPRGLLRFLAGSLGLALVTNLGFRALAGAGYWEQVYLFHTLKPVDPEQVKAGWLALRTVDWAWLAGPWAAVVIGGALRGPLRRRLAGLGLTRGATLGLLAAGAALVLLVVYRSWRSDDPVGAARVLRDLGVLLEGKEFRRVAYYHAGLLLVGLLLPFAWAGARLAKLPVAVDGGARGPTALFVVLILGIAAELSVLRETYSFYYLVLLLPAALAAGAAAGLAWA